MVLAHQTVGAGPTNLRLEMGDLPGRATTVPRYRFALVPTTSIAPTAGMTVTKVVDELELRGWTIELSQRSAGVSRLRARHEAGPTFETADHGIGLSIIGAVCRGRLSRFQIAPMEH